MVLQIFAIYLVSSSQDTAQHTHGEGEYNKLQEPQQLKSHSQILVYQ